MKLLILPKNKFLRLLLNVVFIIVWFFICFFIIASIQRDIILFLKLDPYSNFSSNLCWFYLLIPIFFTTRYIWFEKSRNRIFYGLFDKLKTIRKFEPRIYTTTSNADELKKYAELRDQGIITEEEFQYKKKKLLDL